MPKHGRVTEEEKDLVIRVVRVLNAQKPSKKRELKTRYHRLISDIIDIFREEIEKLKKEGR